MQHQLTEELLRKCPHIASLDPSEQKKAIEEAMRAPHSIPHGEKIISTCPVTGQQQSEVALCPYQHVGNDENDITARKSTDFKCSKCSAYLVGCVSSKNNSLCKYCFETLLVEEKEQYSVDSFKQYLTDSYVEILLERNDPNILMNVYSEDEVKIKKIEHFLNISRQEFILNKNCGIYWMEKTTFLAMKCTVTNKGDLNPKLVILFGIASGNLYDMAIQIDNADFASIESTLEESIKLIESLPIVDKELDHISTINQVKLGDVNLYKLKNYEKAKQIYRSIIHKNVNLDSVIISTVKIGDIHLLSGENELALEAYKQALTILEGTSIQQKLKNWIESKIQKVCPTRQM